MNIRPAAMISRPKSVRIVVKKFELWVPKLMLAPEGRKLVNKNFLKPTQWRYLKETLTPGTDRRDAGGQWLISAGVKNAKHVFLFIKKTARLDVATANPYSFDTFARDGGAKLASCRLQYGSSFYPEIEYSDDDQIRIRLDLIDFSYRRNDVNTGTQLNGANYSTLYPIVYFDLRPTKESMTGDEKQLKLHYTLNQAATADYRLFAAVFNEEGVMIKTIGNELVAAT